MDTRTGTILVVDDNEWNRDVLTRRLKRHGFQVLVAGDGAEALSVVRRASCDLILLDIMMPGITGIEVLRILRKTHPPAELPIIMATAKDQSEDIVEALNLGANDYVTKPLDFPVVLARIEAQLRTRITSGARSVTTDAEQQSIGLGRILAGKYRLESHLGAGNFGTVYRATQVALERPVAVKVLQTKVESSASALARFQQEGISACRVSHPNAVSVIDFDVTPDGIAFLVMELLEGRSLSAELKETQVHTPARSAEILFPVCDVLAEAHNLGIIHRDIKPGNIFLHQVRQSEVIKVLDFGIAKLVGEQAVRQNLTLDDGVLGTPAYMAPERLEGKEHDPRADVYSLGILLFQLLTGELPFRAKTADPLALAMMQLREKPRPLRSVAPQLSAGLEALIEGALEKDYRNRPDTVTFARSLAECLEVSPPDFLDGESESRQAFDAEGETLRLADSLPVWKPPDDL